MDLALMRLQVANGVMNPHTRALVAASAFACVTGKPVAGVHDHSSGKDLRIAAEFRGGRVQGFDGERGVAFGGTLPELLDAGDNAFISLEIDGTKAKGFDRGSSTFYEAHVAEGAVQVFDHGQGAWFAYDVQDPASARSYHRKTG